MAKMVTEEEKILMNQLFLKYKSYSAVGRELNRAPTTVKKYIIPNYVPQAECEIKKFTSDEIPTSLSMDRFLEVENFGDLCVLEKYEDVEVMELWKEIPY